MKSKNKNQLGEITICDGCGWFGCKIEFENNECPNCYQIMPIQKENTCVIDLDSEAWKDIKKAAEESIWLPPECMMNDWVSDVCKFLRYGRNYLEGLK
jgi:hypothetical protein